MTLPVLFGANVDPVWQPNDAPLRHARAAEQLGLDLVTIQDHPYQAAFYDAWTLLTYLAGKTDRVTLVPTVATLPLRPPAVLAKSAASLDLLTGGRVQLGLGAGAFWDAIAAMGGPRRSPGEAVEALDEAIQVIRAMWSGERSVRVEGTPLRPRRHTSGPYAQPGAGDLARGLRSAHARPDRRQSRRLDALARLPRPRSAPGGGRPDRRRRRRGRPRPRPATQDLQHLRSDRERVRRGVPGLGAAVDRPARCHSSPITG